MKSTRTAYLLWLFSICGLLGFQQLYLGKTGKGIAYFFTCGFWGIGAAIDFFTLEKQVEKYNCSYYKSDYHDYIDNSNFRNNTTDNSNQYESNIRNSTKQDISYSNELKNEPQKTILKEILTIGYVEQKGSIINVYDSNSKHIKGMNSAGGELKGYGTDFFVLKKGEGNATTYDLNCKYIKSIAIGDYEVIGASGNCFTTKKKNQIRLYDKNGLMTSSRNV